MENILQSLPTKHQDMIHDINFNYFGTRMATASSDQYVKIWNKDSNGQFKFHSEFKASDGPIWKIKWALPEFGNILAVCSYDRIAFIFEEKQTMNQKDNKPNVEWVRQYQFQDFKDSVEDIKFSPRHNFFDHLYLALASKDGQVKICKCENEQNLKQWKVDSKIQVPNKGVNCISWKKDVMGPWMIAIGIKYNYQFNTQIINQTQVQKLRNDQQIKNQTVEQEDQVFFYIYQRTVKDTQWQLVYKDIERKCVENDGINDISWVGQMGKNYNLIAICGKFGLKVVKFTQQENREPDIEVVEILSNVEVWRVSWNIMGTLLSCSDSNNQIRVYKKQKDPLDWKLVSSITDQIENGEIVSQQI